VSAMPVDALREDLARSAFGLGAEPRELRLGAEIETIPIDAATGAQLPIAGPGLATLPLLRRHGAAKGWIEGATPHGAPFWRIPGVGTLAYEPGGQIELSADPCRSALTLVEGMRGVMLPLGASLRDAGVELLAAGVEPLNPLASVPLQLTGMRYRRMTAFLESIGTGGVRMMRQTAAMQVAVDWGDDPLATWRLLNAMAPYVVAIFASSPCYEGAPTGHRSTRAAIWRALDGGRTGVFHGEDAVASYLRFALDAPAILSGGDAYPSFGALLGEPGIDGAAWREHLSTLFPEVRPRGFAEVRSADAVAPDAYAAPLVLLGGIAYHAPTRRDALELLAPADGALLERAGRHGLDDPAIAATAGELAGLALRGAAALPRTFPPPIVEEAAAFFDRYTLRGRSPADDFAPPARVELPAA
jgi:glutamate--cysteine ligase